MSEDDDESPSFYGLYRGVVDSTADPEHRGRLMVKVQQVNGSGALGWALPCFPYLTQKPTLEASCPTGEVTGTTQKITLRLPKRGDPVWVMFENGSPSSPVWLGTWIGV